MKKGEKWHGLCVVCGRPVLHRMYTCSQACHDEWLDGLVKEFGEFKKVVDAVTGKTYRVPTRDILEFGLKQKDLRNYPLWEEGR